MGRKVFKKVHVQPKFLTTHEKSLITAYTVKQKHQFPAVHGFGKANWNPRGANTMPNIIYKQGKNPEPSMLNPDYLQPTFIENPAILGGQMDNDQFYHKYGSKNKLSAKSIRREALNQALSNY